MITAVNHATRHVPDLNAAIAFYRDLLFRDPSGSSVYVIQPPAPA